MGFCCRGDRHNLVYCAPLVDILTIGKNRFHFLRRNRNGLMIITYSPCNSRHRARWSQPSPDVLRCEWRGKVYECDLSDPGVEYIVPQEVADVVHKAWRETETGELHLVVPSLGNLAEEVTVNHGEDKELGWK